MIDKAKRKTIIGLAALGSTMILPSSAYGFRSKRVLFGPNERKKVAGFNVINDSRKTLEISDMIVEEMERMQEEVLRIRAQKDILWHNLLAKFHNEIPFEYLAASDLRLYVNIFGDPPHPRVKVKQQGSFENALANYKARGHFNDLAERIGPFYQENKIVLEEAEKKFGVPATFNAAVLGHESSFGKNTGKYPYLPTIYSHYLRTKDGDFWKKEFAKKELSAALKSLPKINVRIKDAKSSFGLAMGPGQILISHDAEGRVISRTQEIPNILRLDDAIYSIPNILISKGWTIDLTKPIERDDPRYVALQRYNGCVNYEFGDHKRELYPAFVLDLEKVLQKNLRA